MCFGSTVNSRSAKVAASKGVTQPASAKPSDETYSNVANKADDAYVKAAANKKGRFTTNALDVLGTLIRARRDGNDARVGVVLDEFVADFD